MFHRPVGGGGGGFQIAPGGQQCGATARADGEASRPIKPGAIGFQGCHQGFGVVETAQRYQGFDRVGRRIRPR